MLIKLTDKDVSFHIEHTEVKVVCFVSNFDETKTTMIKTHDTKGSYYYVLESPYKVAELANKAKGVCPEPVKRISRAELMDVG